jgi:hypothetical protein
MVSSPSLTLRSREPTLFVSVRNGLAMMFLELNVDLGCTYYPEVWSSRANQGILTSLEPMFPLVIVEVPTMGLDSPSRAERKDAPRILEALPDTTNRMELC